MALVFQYGSNMSSKRLNDQTRLNGHAKDMGSAITEKEYELTFDLWSQGSGCAAGDIVEGRGKQIWGVIYEVPDHLIKRSSKTPAGTKTMDEIEGRKYQRISIKLRRPDGTEVKEEVFTYVGNEADRDSKARTSLEYVKHYFDGMKEHQIPADHVEFVRQAILSNNPTLGAELEKYVPTADRPI